MMDKFYYVFSYELKDFIQIKIGSVHGSRPQASIHDLIASSDTNFVRNINDIKQNEPYVVCQVFSDGQSLCSPVQTSYKSLTDRWNWNEWITLPLRYCDIPRYAVLAFSIHELVSPSEIRTIGSSTISIFAADGTFRRGIFDIKIWPNVQPDVNFDSSTPGKVEHSLDDDHLIESLNGSSLNELKKPIIAWNDDIQSSGLDELSRIAKLTKAHCDGHMINQEWLDKLSLNKTSTCIAQERSDSKSMLLSIDFSRTTIDNNDCIVQYYEPAPDDITWNNNATDNSIDDPELESENIIESKHMTLTRTGRKTMDKDLKPTMNHLKRLQQIASYPPRQFLSADDQDLVWKYRFYLTQEKKALTKFLQCVRWDKDEQVEQALELLKNWSNIDIEDALELLGPSYVHQKVRSYAVSRLRQAPDEELTIYLLQLVQALRYENSNIVVVESSTDESTSLENEGNSLGHSDSIASDQMNSMIPDIDLSTFLIQHACEKPPMANFLIWYSSVEAESSTNNKDKVTSAMYKAFIQRLIHTLETKNDETRRICAALRAQKHFVGKLVELTDIIKKVQGTAQAKEAELKKILQSDNSSLDFDFRNFEPIPLPLDPDIYIRGIIPEKTKVFKSAQLPFLFVCETTEGKEYPLIFKNGDDLRQDQLILQMITLMDRILRREKNDLKLTPYRVIATGIKYGFVQFIESLSLGSINQNHGGIYQYLQMNSKTTVQDQNVTLENRVSSRIMDAYVRSCAGYCVITYILGIGDRHQDNILLRKTGEFFHIDFGFIMGRDPKPQPQPMRLSSDMLNWLDKVRLRQFYMYCFTTFIILRKYANVFANLFNLMLDANIPDITLERDETVKKLLNKFQLDLDDEKAAQYLKDLMDSSIRAILPQLYDFIHFIAVQIT